MLIYEGKRGVTVEEFLFPKICLLDEVKKVNKLRIITIIHSQQAVNLVFEQKCV